MFLGDENTVFVKQKDYSFFLGGRLRRETWNEFE